MTFIGESTLFLIFLLVATFLLTLPFGRWRAGSRRFSLPWFLAIHLPIPFILLMRMGGGFSWRTIPFFLASTILGQFIGGRLTTAPTSPP